MPQMSHTAVGSFFRLCCRARPTPHLSATKPFSSTSAAALETTQSSMIDLRDEGGLRHSILEWTPAAASDQSRLVLFFHANSFGAGPWAPVVQRIRSIQATAIDSRGHGDSDAPMGIENYRWELIGQDFARIVKAVTKRYGRAPDACVTHSFSGDCFLMELAERPIDVGRMILLDPVLSDKDGATTGAQRLAKGTRRLGEKEADGWDSAEAVGNSLERTLRVSLDSESKAAFARFCSAPDADGRWRLKCSRENEACGYENRVALADHLETKDIHADVHLIFSERRRAAPEDQAAVFERDWKEAERVVGRCHSGAVHLLPGVGHFLVLEAPSLVAETIEGLLPKK
eukprot:TRINITY_DN65478_c0_g1_i2.p1 TRINITY_DN65478_c0_g1~~TRINITY_DN65478_c0_g1_i2.p1  ORF type:complete len:344 (+),score=53.67 TRINITY_DN65478_c0_g1_i2:62-1093(+)